MRLFPVDAETLRYLSSRAARRSTSRSSRRTRRSRASGARRHATRASPTRCRARSRRPSSRPSRARRARRIASPLQVREARRIGDGRARRRPARATQGARAATGEPAVRRSSDGAVVIAAITSCTNTSNPAVLIAAGLLAQKAVAQGLTRKPWVKTSLAPGSQGRHRLPDEARPAATTSRSSASTSSATAARRASATPARCPTRSRPRSQKTRPRRVRRALGQPQLRGPRQPAVRANYLASPPLVVAYALAGKMNIDLDEGAARHGQGRQAGLPARTSGRRRQEIARRRSRSTSSGAVRDELRARVRRRRATGRRSRSPPARPSRGTTTRPTSASRRSSTT